MPCSDDAKSNTLRGSNVSGHRRQLEPIESRLAAAVCKKTIAVTLAEVSLNLLVTVAEAMMSVDLYAQRRNLQWHMLQIKHVCTTFARDLCIQTAEDIRPCSGWVFGESCTCFAKSVCMQSLSAAESENVWRQHGIWCSPAETYLRCWNLGRD